MQKRFILFAIMLAMFSSPAFSQNYDAPQVTISERKANIGGTTYYVHSVLPKQTLYSICQAYGVT
ncbi:MAG: hypothetical protein HUJ90_07255, partial [Bacteroidales bacterium]|nr:hypothetical protein [Bacteroidales bacterium]